MSPAGGVAIIKEDSLYSSETRVNPLIRSWNKLHLPVSTQCCKSIGDICSNICEKPLLYDPVRSELDNFKPTPKHGIFRCIAWLDGSLLGGDD